MRWRVKSPDDLIGSKWQDSNGHVLTVTKVVERETKYGGWELYGDTSNCTCSGWWGRVHTSPEEFPDYHADFKAFIDEYEGLSAKRIFGWDRIS